MSVSMMHFPKIYAYIVPIYNFPMDIYIVPIYNYSFLNIDKYIVPIYCLFRNIVQFAQTNVFFGCSTIIYRPDILRYYNLMHILSFKYQEVVDF